MSISDKTRKSLDKIGLTSYEIRTFSSLLKAGEITASDLSQKSGVPYSKIYEVLLVPLYEKSGTSERPDIWVLSGTINIASKILEMVESCKNEVLIALPKASEDLVKQALPKLRLLHDKRVDITILTSDSMDKDSLKAISRVAKVKVKKGLFGGGIISDKRYVVILLGPEVGDSTSSDIVAIWADHAGLAGFARVYFEYLLKDAKEV
jgi:sugar-specific transcriptional regulator TrmB